MVVVVLGLLGGGGEAPATVRWAVSWCVSARNRLGSGRKVGRRRGRRGVAAGIVHATRLQRQLVGGGDGGRRRRAALEELTAVYHLPREQAAASLRVGCTFLKKICRTYGIKRWPSRKLAALNNHIDELGLLATKCCPEHDSDMHSNLQLAIRHAEDTRLNIYQNPNCAITRDLYRELHSFRKQCEMQWSAKARSDQYYSYLE